jgi:hypothetical protein
MHLTITFGIKLLARLPLIYEAEIFPVRPQAAGTFSPTKPPTTFPSNLLHGPIQKPVEVSPRNTF